MSNTPNVLENDADAQRIVALLRQIHSADVYYPGRSEEESQLLRRMARLGLIRWCRYPDEFYVVDAAGRDILADAGAEPSVVVDSPMSVDLSVLTEPPHIQGSVQSMYRLNLQGSPHLLAMASDRGSVFDFGTFFSIPGSGQSRTLLRQLIYAALADPDTWSSLLRADFLACYADEATVDRLVESPLFREILRHGMRTHHVGLVDPLSGRIFRRGAPEGGTSLALVKEFPVIKPERIVVRERPAWDYHSYQVHPAKVTALEHVFRRGNPGGSSLQQRYDQAVKQGDAQGVGRLLTPIGIVPPLRPWTLFSSMVYDCATKFEDHDRHLSWQETVHLAGVDGQTFERIVLTLDYATIFVTRFFARRGLVLWDLKWEVAVSDEGIWIVDTLDHDSVRITGSKPVDGGRCYVHFNKQAIRDYCRVIRPDWYAAINDAKAAVATDSAGRGFREIYDDGVLGGIYPTVPKIDPRFTDLQSAKYQFVTRPLSPDDDPDAVRRRIESLVQEEILYYDGAGKLDAFLELSSADN